MNFHKTTTLNARYKPGEMQLVVVVPELANVLDGLTGGVELQKTAQGRYTFRSTQPLPDEEAGEAEAVKAEALPEVTSVSELEAIFQETEARIVADIKGAK